MSGFLFLAVLLLALPALADEDLGRTGDWQAFRGFQNKEPVCYMSSFFIEPAPKTKPVRKGKKKKKAPVPQPRVASVTITFRPKENLFPVFNYKAGVSLKNHGESQVTAGIQRYSLFNAGDSAWARLCPIDQDITEAVRREKRLEIRARTAKGKILRDKFSLKGSEAAYRKITKACGIP